MAYFHTSVASWTHQLSRLFIKLHVALCLFVQVVRRNLTGVDTTHTNFESLAAVPTVDGEEVHGGEDVAVYATG